MYNETYDEYIRSILGYSTNNLYNNNYTTYNNRNNQYQNSENLELEKYYPEIYKIVYPMIRKKCDNFIGNITNEEIENITDEIYYALDSRDAAELMQANASNGLTKERKSEVRQNEKMVEKRDTRQVNRNLRDLIQILLIRELLNKPGRPPFGSHPPIYEQKPPMRPPFRPGSGSGIFNREFEQNSYDVFEY